MELKMEDDVKMGQAQPQNETVAGQDPWMMENDVYVQDMNPYATPKAMLTKKEFYKHPVMKKARGNINSAAIITYICVVATFLLSVILFQNVFGMVDVLLLLGLGLGIHIGKSRACAGVLMGYSLFNVIYMIITTGQLGGYWIVIAAVVALMGTCSFQKAWKEYSTTGTYPGV